VESQVICKQPEISVKGVCFWVLGVNRSREDVVSKELELVRGFFLTIALCRQIGRNEKMRGEK